MHQQFDWAFPNPPRAQRPRIERMIGRPAKGKQRLCPQIAGDTANDAARPAIHRVSRAIAPFGRGGEMRPKPVIWPQQQQGLRALGQGWIIRRMKAAQYGQMMQARRCCDGR